MFQLNDLYIAAHPIGIEVGQYFHPLKASEAMRLGAALRPQCKYWPVSEGRSCALGALLEGAGYSYEELADSVNVFPKIRACFPQLSHLTQDIWEMNDVGDFTREQIADWLELQGL